MTWKLDVVFVLLFYCKCFTVKWICCNHFFSFLSLPLESTRGTLLCDEIIGCCPSSPPRVMLYLRTASLNLKPACSIKHAELLQQHVTQREWCCGAIHQEKSNSDLRVPNIQWLWCRDCTVVCWREMLYTIIQYSQHFIMFSICFLLLQLFCLPCNSYYRLPLRVLVIGF